MASYEKLTLDRFKVALKEGKYTSLTGARRAIGKTTSWSGKERASAQELANSHFGGTASAAPKTSSKKPAAKKTAAKKTSAKASAKSIVKPAKKTAAKRAPSTVQHTGAQQKTGYTAQPGSTLEHRVAAHESVGFVSHARVELQQLKIMNPKLDTAKQEKDLFDILENAISHMGQAVPSAEAQATAVPRIEVPKAEPAPARVVKTVTDDVGVQAAGEQTVGEVQQNGTIEDADLTPAERSARDLLSSTPDLGLPRPSQI